MEIRRGSIHRKRRVAVAAALLAALCIGQAKAGAQITVKTLTHVPSPVYNFSLNDRGQAVWATGLDVSSRTYYWDGATITPLGDPNSAHRDAYINNNGWVVWSAYRPNSNPIVSDVYLWKNGGTPTALTTTLDFGETPVINNNNVIVCNGQVNGDQIFDLFLLDPDGGAPVDLTEWDTEGSSTGPRLNDNNVLTWERTVDIPGTTNILSAPLANPQNYIQASNYDDVNLYNGGINSSGQIVWNQYNADGHYDVWKYDPAHPGNLMNLTMGFTRNALDFLPLEPVINAAGAVAWHMPSADGTRIDIYWNRSAGSVLVPVTTSYKKNYPIALNNTGGFLFASGNGLSTGFDILLGQIGATVSGSITLSGAVNKAQTLTFEFRPTNGNATFTKDVTLNADGSYSLSDIPIWPYKLAIKGSRWLRKVITVNATGGDVSSVNATLLPGDINNDNTVNILDLGLLADTFGKSLGQTGFNPNADLNCDGKVNIADLGLLADSFGKSGDP
jgi:hypothetical protein